MQWSEFLVVLVLVLIFTGATAIILWSIFYLVLSVLKLMGGLI